MLDLGLSTTSTAIILPDRLAVVSPYPPPSGYLWEPVVSDGAPVFEHDEPVVELVRIKT